MVTRSRTYDLVGNVLTVTNRNGRMREFTYDNINRQLTEKWLDAASQVIRTIAFAYDAKGRLTNINDSDSAYAYTYDNLDRLTTIDNDGTPNQPHVVLTLGYDSAGRRTSVSATVDGVEDFTNDYAFDGLDRLMQIKQSGTGVAEKRVDYVYRSDGAYDSITRYADLDGTSEVATSSYGYDSAGRLTDLTHTNGSTTLAGYTWTYDANGRITGFTSPDGSVSYSYDANGQLTAADNSALADESYSYDENGNRTISGYVTDDDNRLTSDGTYDYEYDAEGNRTKRTSIATGDYEQYTWDYRNRLTEIVFKDSTDAVTKRVRYTYDALNRRIGKEVDADADNTYESVERYAYDGDNIALVFDGSGTLVQRYLHGAGVDDVVAEEDASGSVSWMLADHQGSVRDVINSSGASLDQIVYDSYGNVLSRTGTTTLRYAYTGRELDQESELYFYRARCYDAGVGRFIGQDPKGFGAGDTNLYRYVGNSTPNFRDPSGLEADQKKSGEWSDQLPNGATFVHNPFSADPNNGIYVKGLEDHWRDVVSGQGGSDGGMNANQAWALAAEAAVTNRITDGSYSTADLYAYRNILAARGVDSSQFDSVINPLASDLSARLNQQNEAVRYANGVLTRGERLQGSGSILASTFTFGKSDDWGWTQSSRYQGPRFAAARVTATIAREAGMTLLTLGTGTLVQAGRGGAALYTANLALRGREAWQAGEGIGQGVVDLGEKNYGSAALHLTTGALGVVGACGSVPRTAEAGSVVRNALGDAELAQAQALVKARGGTFVGAPKDSFPGIDGWLDGTPTSLKGVGVGPNENWAGAVARETNRAWKSVRDTGFSGVRLHIDAPNLTAEMVTDFATHGPGFAKVLTGGRRITHISVMTKYGILNFF